MLLTLLTPLLTARRRGILLVLHTIGGHRYPWDGALLSMDGMKFRRTHHTPRRDILLLEYAYFHFCFWY